MPKPCVALRLTSNLSSSCKLCLYFMLTLVPTHHAQILPRNNVNFMGFNSIAPYKRHALLVDGLTHHHSSQGIYLHYIGWQRLDHQLGQSDTSSHRQKIRFLAVKSFINFFSRIVEGLGTNSFMKNGHARVFSYVFIALKVKAC